MSLSRMRATTLRWFARPPLRAAVTHFSATGRMAFARASVVTSDSAAISDATRLPNMAFWCDAEPPIRRPRLGVACLVESSVPCAQRQATLVQALDHLVGRLLAEVGDGQQVLHGALDQLADRVDLGALEAVARTLGQVKLLDAQVEVGRPARGRPGVAQLEALRGFLEPGHQFDQVLQGLSGRSQRLTGRDGAVGLDVEHEAVV